MAEIRAKDSKVKSKYELLIDGYYAGSTRSENMSLLSREVMQMIQSFTGPIGFEIIFIENSNKIIMNFAVHDINGDRYGPTLNELEKDINSRNMSNGEIIKYCAERYGVNNAIFLQEVQLQISHLFGIDIDQHIHNEKEAKELSISCELLD